MTACEAHVIRSEVEAVYCRLPAGHDGPWHMGRADFTDRYTWPITHPAHCQLTMVPAYYTKLCHCNPKTLRIIDLRQPNDSTCRPTRP